MRYIQYHDVESCENLKFWDTVYALYQISQCILSNERRKDYSSLSFKDLLKDHIDKVKITYILETFDQYYSNI